MTPLEILREARRLVDTAPSLSMTQAIEAIGEEDPRSLALALAAFAAEWAAAPDRGTEGAGVRALDRAIKAQGG